MDQNNTRFNSDHFSLTFNVGICPITSQTTKAKVVFDYKNANWQGLCDYLIDCDFSACLKLRQFGWPLNK